LKARTGLGDVLDLLLAEIGERNSMLAQVIAHTRGIRNSTGLRE
jgi:hypothetical protein